MQWKTATSPRTKKSKNEQVESDGNDDRFFQYRRRNHDWMGTVNQKYNLEVLTKLREWVRKKRPELWKKKSWILREDNAPAHKAVAVKQFLADKCIPVLEQPPPPPFTGFNLLWLLLVPQTEKCIERN
jgi:hypothetical protein